MEGRLEKCRGRFGFVRTEVKPAGGSQRRASRLAAWNRRWERLADLNEALGVAGMAAVMLRMEEIEGTLKALMQSVRALKEDLTVQGGEAQSEFPEVAMG